MQKANLGDHLFRGTQPLPWDIRLKILIGAAKGLAFLHASERPVIHRDIRLSNILLDGSFNARISGFGFAMIGHPHSLSRDTDETRRQIERMRKHLLLGPFYSTDTCMMDASPEYGTTGAYVRCDVYGFGVVLLEMLTGLWVFDTTLPSEQHNLIDWISPRLSHRRTLTEVMDRRLEGKYPLKAAMGIARLSLVCLEHVPRPSMQEVVDTLERIESANKRPKEAKSDES